MNSEAIPERQHCTAFDELRRDAATRISIRGVLSDYGPIAIMVLCYGNMARVSNSFGAHHFLSLIAVVLLLHSVSARRAERRHRLLLDALAQVEGHLKLQGIVFQRAERRDRMLLEALAELERLKQRDGDAPRA